MKFAFRCIFLVVFSALISCVPVKRCRQVTPCHADTIHVYHLLVTDNRQNMLDSSGLIALNKEIHHATDCISSNASRYNVRVTILHHWINNRDSALGSHFLHKLPTRSLKKLSRHQLFKIRTRKRHGKEPEKYELVRWSSALYDSAYRHGSDTMQFKSAIQSDNILMYHLLRVRTRRILGFYGAGRAYIGLNKSLVIAHETMHHLGAADLYIHRYWPGKRSRIVRKQLQMEMMNFRSGRTNDCANYYISDYTAYLMAWSPYIPPGHRPLLKRNIMSLLLFFLFM